jgi:uncharacterized protein YbaR (Trm112 family)
MQNEILSILSSPIKKKEILVWKTEEENEDRRKGEQEIVYIAIDEIVGQTEKEGVSKSDGKAQPMEEPRSWMKSNGKRQRGRNIP